MQNVIRNSLSAAHAAGHRSGAGVIIVVIALLMALMFLGLVFYEFTSMEKNAAEAAARNSERDDQVDLPYPEVAESALQQLIIGAPYDAKNSALSFGDSMIEDLLGRFDPVTRSLNDTAPHSGRGILIWATGDTAPGDGYPDAGTPAEIQFDVNNDGTPDWDGTNFVLNFSPPANLGYNDGAFDAAWGGSALVYADFLESDQGYTYPDINSPWLAQDFYLLDSSGTLHHVIKPSFFFPQYFPDYRAGGSFTGLTDTSGSGTERQVLSPHIDHVVAGPSALPRYLTAPTNAQSGDTSRIIPPFQFDFQNDADGDGDTGEMGIWTGDDRYELSVDVDNDGTPDAILVDIGYPIIDLPGGRQVVPLVAFKVIELDGLFDMNSHGNPALAIGASNTGSLDPYASVYGFTDAFGASDFMHFSNWGYSPAEINLLVGLGADPTDPSLSADQLARATLPHRGMYALTGNGGLGFDVVQLANTEFFFSRVGRFESFSNETLISSNPTDHYVGLWGANGVESGLMHAGFTGGGSFPSPGALADSGGGPLIDDDGDDNVAANNGDLSADYPSYPPFEFTDGGDGGIWLPANGMTRPVATPPVVHPLDTVGFSNDLQPDPTPGPDVGARPVLASNGVNPMTWKQYDPASLPQNPGTTTVHGVTPLNQAVGGILAPIGYDALLNEPDEIRLEPSLMNGSDAPFGFEELAGLHWSENDWDRYGPTSRLRQLLPFNFDWSPDAPLIRSQYSVSNVDRLEFGHHAYEDATNSRLWEFNDHEDYDNDGADDGDGEDLDGDGDVTADVFRFPPRFTIAGALLASRHDLYQSNGLDPYYIVPEDPFRPETRRLLTVSAFDGTPGRLAFPQHRLNINRILADDEASGGPVAFDSNGNPRYRPLVPHPAEGTGGGLLNPGDDVADMIHEHTDPIPYGWGTIAGDPMAQEWWARYDRQRLARDIYVLLYTLGGPDDLDVTTTAYSATGDANSNGVDDMVEAMAQFAVNFVDQVDRDSVITRFEYDPDLSDGWTNAGATEVVYGVEHQQLVFSEVMYIQNEIDAATDHTTTLHNDTGDTHRWLHVELRNASPFPVDMQEETWRLARMVTGTNTIEAAVDFGNGATYRTVNAGENILITMHDGFVTNGDGEAICSDFYADVAAGTELESIIPDNGTTLVDEGEDPDPTADIDLCDELRAIPVGHDAYYIISQPMAGGTTLVAPEPSGGITPETFDLVLMRGRKTATAGTIEWIEVDRFVVETSEYGPGFAPGSDSQTDNDTELAAMNSRERWQPFDQRVADNPGATPPRNHSMVTGAGKHDANDSYADPAGTVAPTNSALYPDFTAWQPHFDRDYASVMELLSLPLFGADDVVSQLYENTTPPDAPILDYDFAAGLRFMNPDGSDADASGATVDPAWENRWYRLLEFLEVRERTHDSLSERLQFVRRTYGRMNLNGIRHPHVLAGLVDDAYHLEVRNLTDPTDDLLEPGVRDWFDELLLSRDGLDHISSLPLPGLPQSVPFRNLSHINAVDPDQSEQDTILRSTPRSVTDPTLDFYNLFEARSADDLPVNGGTDEVDYHTRNRLLGKVHNLTTNRSHLFACWIGVEFFEAHQVPVDVDGDGDPDSDGDGIPEALATQVGGLAGDLPMRRLFCVIDRSRLEEAYDPTTGRFDFRQFIVYQRWID